MQFCKLKNHIDHLGLVRAIQTAVLFPVENTFATLKNKVGANWVHLLVQSFVPSLFFWQQHNCAIVFILALMLLLDCVSDVTPYVRGIVAV